MLEVRDVSRSFGGVRAVDEASFAVERGSITSLIGPNGAGKSTLFNIVAGYLRSDSGSVLLGGRRIDRLPPHRVARLGLARTFQTARALGRLTVLENVVLAAPGHPGERLGGAWLRRSASREFERRARERALELLGLVRLDGLSGDYAGTRFFGFPPFSWLSSDDRAYVRLMLIGLVLIALMLFRPEGILGRREEMVLE